MIKLEVGIIGLGVGEQHILGYNSHPNTNVKMVCEFSIKKIDELKKNYPNITTTNNADDILENSDIDIVSIASYDNYHYEQIIKALKNDKHVFVEKPICLYERELKEIKKLLDSNPNIKISSNLIMRKYPRFQYLKKIISDGELGDIYYLEGDYNYGRLHKILEGWRGKIDFYSVIYGGAIHLVDLILWLSEKEVKEVFTYGNNILTEKTSFRFNDFTVSLLKFNDGVIAKISSNFGCVFPHFHGLSIYGSKATFVNDFEYGRLYKSRDQLDSFKKIDVQYKSNNKGELIYDFVDFIIEKSSPVVTKQDIFRTMSICFALQKSMETGKPEKVNYL